MKPLLALFLILGGAGVAAQTKPNAQDPKQKPVLRKAMSIPRCYVQQRGKQKIRIDGALNEWPKAMPVSLKDTRQVSGTALGAYRGNASDVSGQMYMTWDEQFLYLAIQVFDDWHIGLRKTDRLHQEIPPIDHVVVTFDPTRDTNAYGNDPGRSEDRSFFFAHEEAMNGKLIVWNRRRGGQEPVKGGQHICTRDKEKRLTIHEARIPWRDILPPGRRPAKKLVFDMQVVINDFDEPTDPMAQTRVGWNFGMGPAIAPGLWGSVMLVESLDPNNLPRMPLPPAPKRSQAQDKKYWVDLFSNLSNLPPKWCTVDTPDPALAGGNARYKYLKDLEGHLGGFPRVDNLEFHYRIQRRMSREVAGIVSSGLPFYWAHAMRDLQRRAVPAPPKKGWRIFRLPQGGWYVRSWETNFVIDPCGVGVERIYMMGGIDFALLTRPQEATRRHDQLLIRMSAAKKKRPFLTHMVFHLPGAKPGSMPVVKAFEEYKIGGLRRIVPFGTRTKDGKVSMSHGYLVEWNDGRTLIHAGLGCTQAMIKKLGVRPDVLIISGHYKEATKPLARDFGARFTILEDVMMASEYPEKFGGRVSLRKALELQNELKPLRSLILAPGESIDIVR